jgi:hypothetical protein
MPQKIYLMIFSKNIKSNVRELCEVTFITNEQKSFCGCLSGVVATDPSVCNITLIDITERRKRPPYVIGKSTVIF